MVNAVILAGGSRNSPVEDVENKALIKIKDKYMVQYIIDSLRQSKCVDKIIIVGPPCLGGILKGRIDGFYESGDSIIDNMKKGLKHFNDKKHVIVCTCDIPLVTVEAIEDFVRQCAQKNVDIGYPIVEKSLNDSKYPGVKRTYVKMKDGTYTGGNIIYVNPDVIDRCLCMAEKLVENRKNAIRMGRAIGVWTLVKLFLGILSIVSVEKRAKRLLGVNARAIETHYPEIGNDVDKIADVEFVNKYINTGA